HRAADALDVLAGGGLSGAGGGGGGGFVGLAGQPADGGGVVAPYRRLPLVAGPVCLCERLRGRGLAVPLCSAPGLLEEVFGISACGAEAGHGARASYDGRALEQTLFGPIPGLGA